MSVLTRWTWPRIFRGRPLCRGSPSTGRGCLARRARARLAARAITPTLVSSGSTRRMWIHIFRARPLVLRIPFPGRGCSTIRCWMLPPRPATTMLVSTDSTRWMWIILSRARPLRSWIPYPERGRSTSRCWMPPPRPAAMMTMRTSAGPAGAVAAAARPPCFLFPHARRRGGRSSMHPERRAQHPRMAAHSMPAVGTPRRRSRPGSELLG